MHWSVERDEKQVRSSGHGLQCKEHFTQRSGYSLLQSRSPLLLSLFPVDMCVGSLPFPSQKKNREEKWQWVIVCLHLVGKRQGAKPPFRLVCFEEQNVFPLNPSTIRQKS
jgi:hypothetical protein